jgi:hypothetical protein
MLYCTFYMQGICAPFPSCQTRTGFANIN